MLGGGGGTFGILTYFKFQLHKAPSDGFIHLSLTVPIGWHGKEKEKPCNGSADQVR